MDLPIGKSIFFDQNFVLDFLVGLKIRVKIQNPSSLTFQSKTNSTKGYALSLLKYLTTQLLLQWCSKYR